QYPMNYTTIRGFETTGSSGRVTFGGNFAAVEYVYVHDISVTGPNILFHNSVTDYPSCTETFGRRHDITIRNNVIEHGEGEGIYVGGTYTRSQDGGCLSYGNTHS